MDKKTLKNMPLTAFNDEGWMKPPFIIYLNLIFMSKGLLIFIGSLASMKSGDQILALFYPDTTELYIAIALSIIPLATMISFSIGEIQDNLKIKKVLLVLCLAELAGELSFAIKVIINDFDLSSSIFILFIIQLVLILLAFKSDKFTAFFTQISDNKAILKD